MKVGIIEDNFDHNRYNKAALHPMQSWQWGEARKEMGVEVLRIGEFEDNKHLENVFQITYHKIPHTSFTIGYLPRSVIPSGQILDLIATEAKKRKCIFVKIEPYIIKPETCNLKHFKENKLNKTNYNQFQQITTKSPHPLFPAWTQMMDLTKSEEELLKDMKSKTRYNIRLAQRHGVEVREMTDDKGFEIFSKLYFDTCARQNYRGHDEKYHKIIFEKLKNDIAHIFIAFYKDKPLAAYEVFWFKDVLYYPYGGSSLQYKNVMAPNLLMWEVIRWGKTSGAKIFDMWGSLPPNFSDSNDWQGFTRFKEGYGGIYVQFVGSHDFVIMNKFYYLYNILYKVREKVI